MMMTKKNLKEITKNNNFSSAEEIKMKFTEVSGKEISTRTVRRSLHELGIFSRAAAVKPLRSISKSGG